MMLKYVCMSFRTSIFMLIVFLVSWTSLSTMYLIPVKCKTRLVITSSPLAIEKRVIPKPEATNSSILQRPWSYMPPPQYDCMNTGQYSNETIFHYKESNSLRIPNHLLKRIIHSPPPPTFAIPLLVLSNKVSFF